MTRGCLQPNIVWKISLQHSLTEMLCLYIVYMSCLVGLCFVQTAVTFPCVDKKCWVIVWSREREETILQICFFVIAFHSFCNQIIEVLLGRSLVFYLKSSLSIVWHLCSRFIIEVIEGRALLSAQNQTIFTASLLSSLFTSRWSQLTFNLCALQTGLDTLMTHAYGWAFTDNQQG